MPFLAGSMHKKTVSIKAKHPNPLFKQWLTEWKDIESNEMKQKYYQAALESLQKFPLPLASGRECIILKGFSDKLCKRIDEKIQSTYTTQPPVAQNDHDNALQTIDKEIDEVTVVKQTKGKTIKTKQLKLSDLIDKIPENKALNAKLTYCPAYRSGAYAILCGLYRFHLSSYETGKPTQLLKNELINKSQPFCDKSFTKREQGSMYTAWSSMSTLTTKQLVSKEGNPAKFQLTEAGITIAKKLYEDALIDPENAGFIHKIDEEQVEDILTELPDDVEKGKRSKRKLPKNPSTTSLPDSSQSCTSEETIIFLPRSFKIFLLVDTQETSGSTKKQTYDEIIMELNRLCVQYEIRHLKVGDYAWICRHNETQQELILPFIVERKRMDDFGASIKDGRFHEQKFRLKQSGIQNLIYLVESHGSNAHCGLPLSNIYQAATNTLLQDGFSVKFTDDIRKSSEYLALFTRFLENIFIKKTVMSCKKEDIQKCSLEDDLINLMSFKEFNLSALKTKAMKVTDMFVKQLLQVYGISVDKALAIVGQYPTPRLLKFAYDACESEKEAECLLANIEFGDLRKKVGTVISTTIYQLFNLQQY